MIQITEIGGNCIEKCWSQKSGAQFSATRSKVANERRTDKSKLQSSLPCCSLKLPVAVGRVTTDGEVHQKFERMADAMLASDDVPIVWILREIR